MSLETTCTVIDSNTQDVKMKVDVDHVVCGMAKNSTRASNSTDELFTTIEEESPTYGKLPTKGGILNQFLTASYVGIFSSLDKEIFFIIFTVSGVTALFRSVLTEEIVCTSSAR